MGGVGSVERGLNGFGVVAVGHGAACDPAAVIVWPAVR